MKKNSDWNHAKHQTRLFSHFKVFIIIAIPTGTGGGGSGGGYGGGCGDGCSGSESCIISHLRRWNLIGVLDHLPPR